MNITLTKFLTIVATIIVLTGCGTPTATTMPTQSALEEYNVFLQAQAVNIENAASATCKNVFPWSSSVTLKRYGTIVYDTTPTPVTAIVIPNIVTSNGYTVTIENNFSLVKDENGIDNPTNSFKRLEAISEASTLSNGIQAFMISFNLEKIDGVITATSMSCAKLVE